MSKLQAVFRLKIDENAGEFATISACPCGSKRNLASGAGVTGALNT
jgi:hypothetical protein